MITSESIKVVSLVTDMPGAPQVLMTTQVQDVVEAERLPDMIRFLVLAVDVSNFIICSVVVSEPPTWQTSY